MIDDNIIEFRVLGGIYTIIQYKYNYGVYTNEEYWYVFNVGRYHNPEYNNSPRMTEDEVL